ncbi:lipopolysaccharide biosynthesis protein [Trichlorobacter ammonificans]|uniref:Polysaccharide biosynthesis protein n=1 Tax=Trichlorobacter ammonificans TaxID=2916410 RepID=A0ABN8HHZ9_9BACT|nr:MATE family efflux transporter [Trichlorobacter ammonificans]CAH2032347.1 conserved membrane protein of unknown function [Trichlorobacter ammonificans]
MSSLRSNIVANYAGKIWAAIINIAFVPLYIKYIGIEAYGVIGAFAAIQPLMTILDMGLSPSINREMACFTAVTGKEQQIRDMVRTLEIVYWAVAIVLCIGVLLLSPIIVSKWFHSASLPVETINYAVVIMGLSIVLQWPVGFYTGALMGLQKQVLFNVLNTLIWTMRGAGSVIAVIVSHDPIRAFFNWQLFMSVANVGTIAVALWCVLPGNWRCAPKFKPSTLISVWRFAAGMSAVSILIILFNQLDKIVLSKQLSLADFGYYSLVWQVVGSLFMLYYPIYSAFLPLMTQLVAQKDLDAFKVVYHKANQFMSIAVIPVSVIIILFSNEILLLWTNNPLTSERCSPLLSILLIGAAFNGMLCMQYAVSQAFGKTKHLVYVYFFSVLVYAPTMLIIAKHYGMLGASIAYTFISLIQDYIIVRVTHSYFIPFEHNKWLTRDFGLPLLISLVVGGFAKYVISWEIYGFSGAVTIFACYVVTLLAASAVTPSTKMLIKKYTRGYA